MKKNLKTLALLLLALTLLLSACGKEETVEPAVSAESMETTAAPESSEAPEETTPEEPTKPAATEDHSAVSENDIIRGDIEKAEVDENHHLIVTDKDQNRQDKGYIGGDDEKTTGFVVSFLDYDGTPVKVEFVEKGGSATPPNAPKHTDLDFLAWEGNWENIQSDTLITATYTQRGQYYTVSYCDSEGNLLHTEKVAVGSVPKGYEPAAEAGKIFAGWDGTLSYTADAVLYARFASEEAFSVCLSSANVKAGESAEITLSVRNCPGMAGVAVSLEIPEALSLTEFTFDKAAGGMGTGPETLPKSGTVKFNWFNILKELSGDADLLHLTVTVPAGTPAGEYLLTMQCDEGNMVNVKEEDLTAEWIMGRITVYE